MISVRRVALLAMSVLLLPVASAQAQGRGEGAGSADASGATEATPGGRPLVKPGSGKTDRSEADASSTGSANEERAEESRQGRRANDGHHRTPSDARQRDREDTGGGR